MTGLSVLLGLSVQLGLSVLLLICSFGQALAWTGEGRAASKKQRTILLVDDREVLYRSGTKRVLRPLDRHPKNPMLPSDKPWELTVAYCSVHRDQTTGYYQLWYQAWGKLCYATSEDGIHWVKPNLGLHDYEGESDTNILLDIGFGAGVLFDPRDPDPSRRYKFAYWGSGKLEESEHLGLLVAFSPDGIHWTKHPRAPILKGSHGEYILPPFADDPGIQTGKLGGPPLSTSDVTDPIWDPGRNTFAIYSKTWLDGPDGTMHWKRAVVRTDSKDFVHWSKPRLVMAPDELDGWGGDARELARTAGGGGSDGKQLHSGPAFYYNGMYFSLLQVLDSGASGNMPIELALSHDGDQWERPFRDALFLPPLEDKTQFDASIIWSNATPVLLDDEFRFYYGTYSNQWNIDDDRKQISGVGLATMPRDRFAGVRPISRIGQITMKPLDLRAVSSVTLNADASQGSIRVELLNEAGYRLKGWSKAEANVIQGDQLSHPVGWKNRGIRDLPAGRYKLRIHLDNAQVYAITLN